MMRHWFISNFPLATQFVRAARAQRLAKQQRETWSQHGEDIWLRDHLPAKPHPDWIYVDVGANHPITLSNTFRLYQAGYRGYTVEPNLDLVQVHRIVRPEDICIPVCASDAPALLKFFVHPDHLLSGRADSETGVKTEGGTVIAVPGIPLDTLLADDPRMIAMLSVDVEGAEDAVLKGAVTALERVLFLIIEVSTPTNTGEPDYSMHRHMLPDYFELIDTLGANAIYVNRRVQAAAAEFLSSAKVAIS